MKRLALWLVVCNVSVAASLALGTLHSLENSKEADVSAARQTAVNLANSLSIEVAAELRLIDNALATIALGIAQADDDAERQGIIQRLLAEQRALLPHVAAMRYANAQGTVLAGLGVGESQIDVAGRPYFSQARASAAMVVSEPLTSLVTNDWCTILARRLLTQDGSFYGVVYAVVTAEHFIDRFAQLDMGASGAVALRTGSLRLLARQASSEPRSFKGVGEATVSHEMLRKLAENDEQGWYITPTALDNIERVTAYSRVRGYPFLVFTGLATQEFLADWRREVLRQTGLVAFCVLVVAGFSSYLFVRQRRERRARDLAVKTAREQSLVLENDLVGMIRVRNRVNVWENKAAHRIFGYEAGELRGQSTRLLYLDDATYARVGEGYEKVRKDGRFSKQIQMRRKDGQAIWIDLSGALVSEDESLWMMVDIDTLKRSETTAKDMALRDPLTGLANRRLLDVQLEGALANARRTGHLVALCYIDLDGFKQINDVHGHEAGDAVLNATAQRLRDAVRDIDTVARLGGDEFAVVLGAVASLAEARDVMQRCMERIREPVPFGLQWTLRVDASIGIVVASGQSAPDALLRSADISMYAAKRAGKGRIEASEHLQPGGRTSHANS